MIVDCDLEMVGLSVVRGIIDPDRGRENLDRVLRCIDAAARPGAPTDARDDANWNTTVDRVRIVTDHAAERGIGVSLDLHEGTQIDSASGLLRIVDDVDRPKLGINPDLGNLIRVPRRVEEQWRDTFATCIAHMNYWHVKNYIRMEDLQRDIGLSVPSALDAGEIDYQWAQVKRLDLRIDWICRLWRCLWPTGSRAIFFDYRHGLAVCHA